MAAELKWNKQKQQVLINYKNNDSIENSILICFINQDELEKAKEFLKREMGLNLKYQMKSNIPINFTKEEISTYIKRFRSLDASNKGYITNKELKAFFKVKMFVLLTLTNKS